VTDDVNTKAKKQHILGREFAIWFLLACVIATAAEAGFDKMIEAEELPGVVQSIFNVTGLYQWIVKAARRPLQRFTAVVKIDPENEVEVSGANDVCGQREQIARMICRISRASPNVIVLDKPLLTDMTITCLCVIHALRICSGKASIAAAICACLRQY
jgi:hypothetical protein